MTTITFHPYQNEAQCLQIGGLTIENRLDRIAIFGSIDLTRDLEGRAAARALKEVLDRIVATLDQADLPQQLSVAEPEQIDNPFL